MMKKYCYKCGYGTEYSLKKPNFCSKCGNSFELDYSTKANTNENKIKDIQDIEEDLDILEDNQDVSIPDINELQFDEILNFKSSGEKLKDIISTSKDKARSSRKMKKKSMRMSELEAKKMAQEVLNEGKTLRRKNEKS